MTVLRSRGEAGLHFDDARQRRIATAVLGYDGRGNQIICKDWRQVGIVTAEMEQVEIAVRAALALD